MISALTLSLSLLAAVAIDEKSIPAPNDQAATYQEMKAKTGRNADAQVKLALWCEAHGMNAERIRHLTLATLIDPDHATARGLLGLVRHEGKWMRPADVSRLAAEDTEHKKIIDDYLKLRVQAGDRDDDHWKLGVWCEEHGMKDQAAAHFEKVIKLNPKRDAAWKRLGFKKQGSTWVKPELVAAIEAERDLQKRADKVWKPRLERIREGLHARSTSKRAEAEAALEAVQDPRAVPMIWTIFATGDEAAQKTAVRLLGQIDSQGSSRALAMIAAFSEANGARQSAIQILRRRDPREFASDLIAFIQEPIKFSVTNVAGAGSPGELNIEGKEANLKRVYRPMLPPTLATLPGDFFTMDANGLPVVNRYLNVYSMAFNTTDGTRVFNNSPTLNGEFFSQLASSSPQGQAAAGLLQSVAGAGQTLQGIAGPLASSGRLPNGRFLITSYEVTQTYSDVLQIPIGQMLMEAQMSAMVAQQQLKNDAQSLEAQNAPILDMNRRVRNVLKEASGEDLGDSPLAWHNWFVDLQGFAVQKQLQAGSPRPTFVEAVPINFQPQAMPAINTIASATTVRQTTRVSSSCFAAGTLVHTLDGLRPIESIQNGEEVLTQDTKTGALAYHSVAMAFHNPPDETISIHLNNGETLTSTGIHRLWKPGAGWALARELKPGDSLRTVGGTAKVVSAETNQRQPVYNLLISGSDNYFVGRHGVLARDQRLHVPTDAPFDAMPEPTITTLTSATKP